MEVIGSSSPHTSANTDVRHITCAESSSAEEQYLESIMKGEQEDMSPVVHALPAAVLYAQPVSAVAEPSCEANLLVYMFQPQLRRAITNTTKPPNHAHQSGRVMAQQRSSALLGPARQQP